MSSNVPAVVSRGLVKSFRRKGTSIEAVSGIDLTIEAGERVACIGPNGAGKSTTIKMLTGVLHPTSGSVEVLGLVPWQERRRLAHGIGVLFGQRSQLWAELPARNSLQLLAAIYAIDKGEVSYRITETADMVDALDLLDEPVRNLSLGQRMRCELAACLLHRPPLLFLDEPTIGMDLVAKQRFRDLLVRLNATMNTTVFLTSHDIADVEAVAQRVVVINHGRVLHDAATSELGKSLLSTKLIELRLGADWPHFDLPGVTVTESEGAMVRLSVDLTVTAVDRVLTELLARCSVLDMKVTDPDLEDVIARIYGRPA